jgi:hypothetical protein
MGGKSKTTAFQQHIRRDQTIRPTWPAQHGRIIARSQKHALGGGRALSQPVDEGQFPGRHFLRPAPRLPGRDSVLAGTAGWEKSVSTLFQAIRPLSGTPGKIIVKL